MRRALSMPALFVLAATCACDAPSTSSVSSSAAPTTAKPTQSTTPTPPSTSATPVASASSAPSATTQSKDPIAIAFGGDGEPMGEPASIYRNKQPSGAIVLVPPEFLARLSLDGEGFTANRSPTPGVPAAAVSFRVTPKRTPRPDLGETELGAACGSTVLTRPTWSRAVDVSTTARVWKGAGTYGGGNEPRSAYVLMTTVGDLDVVGCGAWSTSITTPPAAELERQIIGILKSPRLGSAPPADVNGL